MASVLQGKEKKKAEVMLQNKSSYNAGFMDFACSHNSWVLARNMYLSDIAANS